MTSKVFLYVYDITQGMAKQLSRQLVGQHFDGIWHTGVVVYGNEYFYGGGLSYDVPGRTPFGSPLQTIDMGTTNIPQDVFHEYLGAISPRFTMMTYNLLTNNCNNFSNEATMFLLGKGIPSYIIDLPDTFLRTPIGQMMRPVLDQMQSQLSQYHGAHEIFAKGNEQHQGQTPVGPPPWKPPGVPTAPNFKDTSPGAHPHTKIKFPLLSQWQPITFCSGNILTIKNKLIDNFKKSGVDLTSAEQDTLSSLCSIAEKGDQIATAPTIPTGTYVLIEKGIGLLSDEMIFPLLDLLRLLILHPTVCQYYIQNAGILTTIFSRYAKKTEVPKGARIMATRLAANCFGNPEGGLFMVSPGQVTGVIEAFVNVINAEDAQAKTAAAVLAHNLSLYLPRDDSDITTQAITSILYQLPQEGDPQAQYVLLLALGHLLYCNSDGVGLCLSLQFDVSRWTTPPGDVSNLVEAAKEVELLVTTTI